MAELQGPHPGRPYLAPDLARLLLAMLPHLAQPTCPPWMPRTGATVAPRREFAAPAADDARLAA